MNVLVRKCTASLTSRDVILSLRFLEESEMIPVSVSEGLNDYRSETQLDNGI